MPVAHNGGVAIAYEDAGSGRPLLLGHSFLCSGAMWRGQAPALAERYRVLNADLRGHGASGPATGRFTVYDAVDDAAAVLDAAGVERAVWCGLSFGGWVALRAALTRPERVEGLVLVDTDAGAEPAYGKLRNYAMGLGARVLGVGPFLRPIARLMFGATTRREDPELVREWRGAFSRVHLPSVLRGLRAAMTRDSVLERLPEIGVPTLVVVGAEDRPIPPARSREMHARLPDAELVVVPGAGHLSALERPGAVTDAVLDFLVRRFPGASASGRSAVADVLP